jgi:hypothetical protein
LLVVVAAEPSGTGVLMLLQVIVVSDADLEALDAVLASFVVDEVALANLAGDATAAPPPPTLPPSGGGAVVDAHELFPGDCFNDADVVSDSEDYIDQITTVSCDVPHDNEVVLAYEFPDTPFPSDSAVTDELDRVCADAWPGYVGIPYAESILYYIYFSPDAVAWEMGNRMGICAAYDGTLEPLTGSVYMSGM